MPSNEITDGTFYICLECGYKYRGSSFYSGEVNSPCDKCGMAVKERYTPKLTQYISTLVEEMLPDKKPDLRGIKYGEYRGYNQAIAEMRQKLNEWKNNV